MDRVAKSRGQVNAGLTSPGPDLFLVWTQEGSEIRVAGRKGGAGQGAAPQPSPVPRAPGFSFSKVLLTVARLLRTPGGETRTGLPEQTDLWVRATQRDLEQSGID